MQTNERNEMITIADLMEILGGVSKSTAMRVMREIKKVSNVLDRKGMIHKSDWNTFLEVRKNKFGGAYAKN